MSDDKPVGVILIGWLLLLSGAIGLVAVPAGRFVMIFTAIGTQEMMRRELQQFNSWMWVVAVFSAAAYIVGLGLVRNRHWSRPAALIVLFVQLALGVGLTVLAPSALLWVHLIVTASCVAWLFGPAARTHKLLLEAHSPMSYTGLALVGLAAAGLALLYTIALLGLLWVVDLAPTATEAVLVLLPSFGVGLVIVLANSSTNRWPSLGLLLAITGGAMLCLALVASALDIVFGSSLVPSLAALVLLVRLVLHLFIEGGVFVLVGGALSVTRVVEAGSRGRQLPGGVLVVLVVLIFQVIQSSVVLGDSGSTSANVSPLVPYGLYGLVVAILAVLFLWRVERPNTRLNSAADDASLAAAGSAHNVRRAKSRDNEPRRTL